MGTVRHELQTGLLCLALTLGCNVGGGGGAEGGSSGAEVGTDTLSPSGTTDGRPTASDEGGPDETSSSTGSPSGADESGGSGDQSTSTGNTGGEPECRAFECVEDDGCCAEGCGPHNDPDCGTWVGPDNALECTGSPPRVSIAVDGQGNTLVAQRCGRTLSVSQWDIAAGWSVPEVLDMPGSLAPVLAMNAAGQALLGTPIQGNEIAVRHYSPDDGWGDEVAIGSVGSSISAMYPLPQLALDDNGDAVVAFSDASMSGTGAGGTGVLGVLYRDGTWTDPTFLGSGSVAGLELSVAMHEGVALIGWRSGLDYDELSLRRTAADGSVWSPSQTLQVPGLHGTGSIAAGPGGLAVFASHTYQAGSASIRVDRNTPSGWDASLEVRTGSNLYAPQVVVDTEGVATISWLHGDGANAVAEAVRLDGDELGEVFTVDPRHTDQYDTPRVVAAGTRTWIAVDDAPTGSLSMVAIDPNGRHPGEALSPWESPTLAGATSGHAALAYITASNDVAVLRFTP